LSVNKNICQFEKKERKKEAAMSSVANSISIMTIIIVKRVLREI
jgi:hypothetical protein